jgi:hypothetical protein
MLRGLSGGPVQCSAGLVMCATKYRSTLAHRKAQLTLGYLRCVRPRLRLRFPRPCGAAFGLLPW